MGKWGVGGSSRSDSGSLDRLLFEKQAFAHHGPQGVLATVPRSLGENLWLQFSPGPRSPEIFLERALRGIKGPHQRFLDQFLQILPRECCLGGHQGGAEALCCLRAPPKEAFHRPSVDSGHPEETNQAHQSLNRSKPGLLLSAAIVDLTFALKHGNALTDDPRGGGPSPGQHLTSASTDPLGPVPLLPVYVSIERLEVTPSDGNFTTPIKDLVR